MHATQNRVQGTYNGIDYYVYPRIPGNEERQPVVHSIRGRDRATSTLFSFPGMRFREMRNCRSISWVSVICNNCTIGLTWLLGLRTSNENINYSVLQSTNISDFPLAFSLYPQN